MTERYPALAVHITAKSFAGRAVIEDICFTVPTNTVSVILGPSGCGKTTLLRMLAALDRDFEGEVRLGSESVLAPTQQIALMFQDVRLLPWKTINHNLQFVGASIAQCREFLLRVGLDADVGQLYPRQLSGGMAKRVALARALVCNPKMLLLDEPFSDLDSVAKYALYDLLIAQVRSTTSKLSVAMVTHDIAEAVYLADEVLVLSRARPTTLAARFAIDLPRPRLRQSPEFLSLCTSLMGASIADARADTVAARKTSG